MPSTQTRRQLIATAATAALLPTFGPLAAEGPPETTTLRLTKSPTICFAPLYVLGELLRAEGFRDVRYLPSAGGYATPEMVARGELDLAASFAGTVVHFVDTGLPITALSGLHAGCYELFTHGQIGTISELKGRRVGIQTLSSSAHLYLSIMARHVGLDPKTDIEWVTTPEGNAMELFAAGRTDAFLAFPPEPQELRARGVGRMILSTVLDRPWSQYLCCIVYSNAAWIRAHPNAARRAVRAILKAADFCAAEPETAARMLVDDGFTPRLDYALQAVREIPYRAWRDYDAEDTLRFCALRLHDAGMLAGKPNELIRQGADWRIFNELRRELKA